MTAGSDHPKEFAPCSNCGVESPSWEKHLRLPQVGPTYRCSACGHQVYVYDAGDPGETIRQFRPVTRTMVENLLFYDYVGEWPDAELEDLFAQGIERRPAIDYYMTEREGLSQSQWSRELGIRSQQAVAENVRRAREILNTDE